MAFQLIINVLIKFSIISLVGISFFLIFNTGKYYAIQHASIITLAGFLLSVLHENGFSIYSAIILSLIIPTSLGVFIEFILIQKIQKMKHQTFFLIIVSLGIYIILQNIIVIFFGEDLKLITSNYIGSSNKFFGAYITNIQIILIAANAIVIVGSSLLLKKTKLGKEMRAISENSELSSIFGINTNKIILYSFSLGSLIAALSGLLITFDVGMNISTSFNLLFYGVIALIIGGIGNLTGLIFGSLFLAILQNLTAFYIDSKWMEAVTYFILILFLIWKPLGFSGKKLKKVSI
jgi:branched-chain amino acid transport system permease protein